MASPNQVRVQFDAIRSIAHGNIGSGYAAVGSATTAPARIIKIYNATNEDLYISFDGSTNHDIVQTATFQTYEFCTNSSLQGGYFELANNTTIYTKEVGTGPSSGSLYVTVIYATGG